MGASQETVELQSKYSMVIEEKKAFFSQLLDSPDVIASTPQVRRNLTFEEQFLLLSSAMNEDNDTDEDDSTDAN